MSTSKKWNDMLEGAEVRRVAARAHRDHALTTKFAEGDEDSPGAFLAAEGITVNENNADDRTLVHGLDILARASAMARYAGKDPIRDDANGDDRPDIVEQTDGDDNNDNSEETPAQKKAREILNAGRRRRGEPTQDKKKKKLPKAESEMPPVGSLAFQIIRAGMKRRGEIE